MSLTQDQLELLPVGTVVSVDGYMFTRQTDSGRFDKHWVTGAGVWYKADIMADRAELVSRPLPHDAAEIADALMVFYGNSPRQNGKTLLLRAIEILRGEA